MIDPTKPDKIIAGILDYPVEDKNTEFKESIPWPQSRDELQDSPKAQEVIKTIIGMSNSQEPGRIFIGVKESDDGQFKTEGMNDSHLRTYNRDLIFDRVRNYGLPEPKFETHNIEYENKNFIVFTVETFSLSPLICKNQDNLNKLKDGEIYIRTDKPETKKINKPEEMKGLIGLAIRKELEEFSERVEKLFDSEMIPALIPGRDSSEGDKDRPLNNNTEEFDAEVSDLK